MANWPLSKKGMARNWQQQASIWFEYKQIRLLKKEEIILNNKIMWQVANIIHPCYNKVLMKYIFQQKVEISTSRQNNKRFFEKIGNVRNLVYYKIYIIKTLNKTI